MVISLNTKPSKQEFDNLLDATIQELNTQAQLKPKIIQKLKGNKLEPYVRDIMIDFAVGSPFEGSIELIGGQRFPDIVAKKIFGVEVKTTVKNHWKTTGNSVLESTRIDDVERIYILFGKLAAPIEFRYRPYEECLSEIVVTHAPRYLIDMNLMAGKTIFDKLGTDYNTLRLSKKPIEPIISYYRNNLKPGQDLWWIDQNSDESNSLVINVWNNLSIKERQVIKNKAMVYFPELFGGKSDKFSKFSLWLITRKATVCPNVRDLFTAGGRGTFVIKDKRYHNIPRIFINLFENLIPIQKLILQSNHSELSHYWGCKTSDKTKISSWINLVDAQAKSLRGAKHLNVGHMLKHLLL